MGTAADAANKATTVSYSSNIEPSDLNVFTSFRSCNASTTDRSVEKWNESWPVCPSIALKNQAQKKAANCGLFLTIMNRGLTLVNTSCFGALDHLLDAQLVYRTQGLSADFQGNPLVFALQVKALLHQIRVELALGFTL